MAKYELDAVEQVPEKKYSYKGYKLMNVKGGIPPRTDQHKKPIGKYERLILEFLSREDLTVAKVYVQGAKHKTVATNLNTWKRNHPDQADKFRVVTRRDQVYLEKLL